MRFLFLLMLLSAPQAQAAEVESRWASPPAATPGLQRHRHGNTLVITTVIVPASLLAMGGLLSTTPGCDANIPCWLGPVSLGLGTATLAPVLLLPGALQSTRGARMTGAHPRATGLWMMTAGLALEIVGAPLLLWGAPQLAPYPLIAGTGLVFAGALTQVALNRDSVRRIQVLPAAGPTGGGLNFSGDF